MSTRLLRATVLRPVLAAALAASGVAAVVVTAAPAAAQSDPRAVASGHYAEGRRRYDAGDYRGAIAAFSAAERALPSALNDYNLALAYERLDDAPMAVRHYRAYLDRLPAASNRADVEASIARLDSVIRSSDSARQAEEARRAAEARAAEDARDAAEQQRAADEARRAAEAQAAEDARRGADTRADDEAQRVAEARAAADARGAETRPYESPTAASGALRYPTTGDRELDRVASIDLSAARGGDSLPSFAGASREPVSAAAPAGGQVAPAPEQPAAPPAKKPFYKSPVTWVLAGVGLYVLYVLASSNDSEGGGGDPRGLMLPELPHSPAASGPTLFRF